MAQKILTDRIKKLYLDGKVSDKGLKNAVEKEMITEYMAKKIKNVKKT